MSSAPDESTLWILWEGGRSHWAEAAPKDRAKAEEFFAALFDLTPEAQKRGLRGVRFRPDALLELILEKSRSALLCDPERAASLAILAGGLLAKLHAAGGGTLTEVFLSRLGWLTANAHRLRGDFAGAEEALRAAVFSLPADLRTCDHAYFLRSLVLLRWEQGRVGEAVALLNRAVMIFHAHGLGEEEGACRALLGLLYLEESDPALAVAELTRARHALDAQRRPWLAVRAALALATARAAQNRLTEAREDLEAAQELCPLLGDPHQILRAHWLEGRLWFFLDDREMARALVGEARRGFLDEPNLPAVCLATLDLAAVVAAGGREEDRVEAERLVAEIAATFGRKKVLPSLAGFFR
jgi:tetratricopeptide (TPR) repeat protein